MANEDTMVRRIPYHSDSDDRSVAQAMEDTIQEALDANMRLTHTVEDTSGGYGSGTGVFLIFQARYMLNG